MEHVAKVVGTGLLGTEFSGLKFSKDVLVLASGVSNSRETKECEFKRERDLIKAEIKLNPDLTVIYFSTCSVGLKKSTPYTRHKLSMENYIAQICKSYYIYRLPQVAGFVKNTTLISYLIRSAINNNYISIQRYAKRDLIDVTDVSRIVKQLVEGGIGTNSTVNIATGNSISVLEIFNHILDAVGNTANYSIIDTGDEQQIDSSFLRSNLDTDYIFEDFYWQDVLNKYLPLYTREKLRLNYE